MKTAKTFFTEFAKEYEAQSRYKYVFYRRIINQAIGQINKKKCTVLDMGTGNGESALRIAAKLPQSRIIGIDVSAGMLAEAQKKAEKLGIRNISFKMQAIEDVNVKADFAISTFAFHHVKDKKAVFSRLYRLLPKGGRVIIGDYFKPSGRYEAGIERLRKKNPILTKKFDSSWKEFLSVQSKEYYAKHPKEYPVCPLVLARLMKEAGFKKQRVIRTPLKQMAVVVGEK